MILQGLTVDWFESQKRLWVLEQCSGTIGTFEIRDALWDGHESMEARSGMLWFERKTPHIDVGWQMVALTWTVVEPFGGGALVDDVVH